MVAKQNQRDDKDQILQRKGELRHGSQWVRWWGGLSDESCDGASVCCQHFQFARVLCVALILLQLLRMIQVQIHCDVIGCSFRFVAWQIWIFVPASHFDF